MSRRPLRVAVLRVPPGAPEERPDGGLDANEVLPRYEQQKIVGQARTGHYAHTEVVVKCFEF